MSINNLEHHKMYEYCNTRPKYRQGKTLTAVKVVLTTEFSLFI